MSEVNDAAELALKAAANLPAFRDIGNDGREFMVHRNDVAWKEITPANAAPVYKPKLVTQAVQVQTVESFVEYVERMKNPDSMIFADIDESRLLAIIDYHHMPMARATSEIKDVTPNVEMVPAAELCKHTVTLDLPHSIEWHTWIGNDGVLMSHKKFATFLEHNSLDIVALAAPEGLAKSEEEADAPRTLLELTRSLQVVQNVNFNSSVSRHGDYDRIEFNKTADATAKGAITLPQSFSIMIPVYFGESPVELKCFIRKEIDDNQLKIGYQIFRAEQTRQIEFKAIVAQVAGATELTTLYGKPSA